MDWLTVEQAAQELGVSKKTLANRIYAKAVPATRMAVGGLRVHRMVAEAMRAGATAEELQHVAILCRRHHDQASLRRAVGEYLARHSRGAA